MGARDALREVMASENVAPKGSTLRASISGRNVTFEVDADFLAAIGELAERMPPTPEREPQSRAHLAAIGELAERMPPTPEREPQSRAHVARCAFELGLAALSQIFPPASG